MPKGEKKAKKDKKEKKEKREEQAPAEDAAPAEEKQSKQSKPKGVAGARAEIGSPAFMSEVGKLRDTNMKPVSNKADQRKSAKGDVKSALQACLDITSKSLRMCNSSSSQYLLEHIQADAEKLKIHLAQDEDYIEEVRFKHNKLMDLLDETRDYQAVNLQKDLVRNREIRTKCVKLTQGDNEKEALIDQDEMNELLKIRNSIRTWYGGQNMLKGLNKNANDHDGDKIMWQLAPSEIKVSSGKAA
jgi:hypothetical protein